MKKATPSVEFVVPFWGDPGYLREAVDSIRGQSDPDWRATIIDDCYPHADVGAWIAELDDARLTYFRNPQNLGANLNYKRGVELATADYIVIMGADDRLRTDYLANVRQVLAESSPAIVQPAVRVIDESGDGHSPLGDRVKARLSPQSDERSAHVGESLAVSLLGGNWTYFPSICWHRETIARAGFRDFHVVQDLALLIDVIVGGGTLVFDPRISFEYRRHRGSDSALKSATGTRFREEREYFAQIATELDARGWRRAARAARLHWSSRLNAALTVPTALRARDASAATSLIRHAWTRTA